MTEPGVQDLKGIGGWLILVAVGLCLQPLLLLKALSENAAAFKPDTWGVLTTPGTSAYHPLWAPLLVAETGVNLVLLAWSGVLLYFFFSKGRRFPRMVIVYMAVSVAAVIADLAVANAIPAARARLTASEYGQVGRSVIGRDLDPVRPALEASSRDIRQLTVATSSGVRGRPHDPHLGALSRG